MLADYDRGELTQRAFAARHGISVSCLRVWLAKSRRSSGPSSPCFIQMPGGLPISTTPTVVCTLQFPKGHRLEVTAGLGIGELAAICRMVEGL